MPKKTVVVEAELGDKFKLESTMGKHVVYVDQPEELGGTDAGPNPLQYLFLSLAGCVAVISRIVANQRSLPLRSMKLTVQGGIDTDVLLGKSKQPRAGFTAIEVLAEIDADMSPEEKRAFLAEVDSRCPVSDNISNTTPVRLRLG